MQVIHFFTIFLWFVDTVMTSLSSKSSDELCRLLDEYGINHGPIVGKRNVF